MLMKRNNICIINGVILILFFLGCGEQTLSIADVEEIRAEIRTLISEQSAAYETGDIEYFKHAASDDIRGFGTTTKAVYANPDKWAEAFRLEFQSMDTTPYSIHFIGEPRYLSIQVSKTGDMAAAVYEAPAELNFGDAIFPMLYRMATVWKMENGEWRIVQWLGARPFD